MKPRQIPWKWLLLGLLTLLLAGLAILPRQFGDSDALAARITDALEAWTGGEVKLTGPLRVHYFPDVSIKSGFELANATRLPLVKSITANDAKVSIDLAELLLGRIRVDALRLVRPEITLKESFSLVTGPDQTLSARVINLLGGAPVGALRLRDGTIHLPGAEAIKRIDARFEATSGIGAMSSFGSFMLKDETIRFALDCGAPSGSEDSLRVPVSLTVTSKPVTARLAGTASFANGLQLDGDLQANMASARQFLRWTGIAVPDGQSLQALSASGTAHWNGSTLTFDDGSFMLDGNHAVGLLAITPGARPRVDGTLAFERLVLDPYIGSGTSPEPAAAQAPPLEGMLPKYFDADLRISAAEITAPRIKLGRGGFTISANAGVLAGEVGELELCGGQASGRIGLDMSQDLAKATFVGSIFDVPIDGCLQPLALDVPLKGIGGLKTEISTAGRNFDEMVNGATGTVKVNAESGAVPVDFPRLLTAAAPLDGDGWSRNAGLFDTLSADCRLGAGHIWCDTLNIQTRSGLISGSGNVDLTQQTLDWSLFVANPTQPLKASQPGTETGPRPRISISGSLSQPMIRRADRPTLGEGSAQTGAEANQISPR